MTARPVRGGPPGPPPGGLRAYHLGWKKKPAPAAPGQDPESPDLDEVPVWDRNKGGGYKRHITFGVLWVVMGLFLIISTLINSRWATPTVRGCEADRRK